MKIFERENVKILNCDMFEDEGLPSISNGYIDAIITDFPYGTLNKRNKWDEVIDYKKFWKEAFRIGKKTTPTISTAQMPFTAYLISTNYKTFKYALVWEKSKATGYLNAKKQPMRAHEDIVVFYDKQCTYLTDVVRAEFLEDSGYSVQVMEFIDMENTMKNLLIRTVRKRDAIHVKNDTNDKNGRTVLEHTLEIVPTIRKLQSV